MKVNCRSLFVEPSQIGSSKTEQYLRNKFIDLIKDIRSLKLVREDSQKIAEIRESLKTGKANFETILNKVKNNKRILDNFFYLRSMAPELIAYVAVCVTKLESEN